MVINTVLPVQFEKTKFFFVISWVIFSFKTNQNHSKKLNLTSEGINRSTCFILEEVSLSLIKKINLLDCTIGYSFIICHFHILISITASQWKLWIILCLAREVIKL